MMGSQLERKEKAQKCAIAISWMCQAACEADLLLYQPASNTPEGLESMYAW